MFLSLLLVDFLNRDWSARCCELRSQTEPFRVQTGDYRPLPVGAAGLEIGAETIFGDGWSLRLDSPGDPVDKWTIKSEDCVEFKIEYSGVTPPLSGVGAYNLVLPQTWWFQNVQVNNPNRIGSKYEISRDEKAAREALMLYFEGTNTCFDVTVWAARGSNMERRGLGSDFFAFSRHIVEPSLRMR